jgi:hypothetical protein
MGEGLLIVPVRLTPFKGCLCSLINHECFIIPTRKHTSFAASAYYRLRAIEVDFLTFADVELMLFSD